MEHNDRHLDFFFSSLIEYFNEVLIHKNCVSYTFRKYSVKNNENGEISFRLLRSAFDGNKSNYQNESTCLTEEETKKLIKISESWRLRLANVSIEENKLCLKLNRTHAFYTVIKSILYRKSDYGKCFSEKQTVRITSDDGESNEDLTEYRSSILKTAAKNLLELGGYKLADAETECWIHFTTKNCAPKNGSKPKVKLLCGPVVNWATRTKETQITPEEYRRIQLKEFKAKSESKSVDDELLHLLVDASMKVNLLQVKSSQAVVLNLDAGKGGPRVTGSKGGEFLQYNASRLASIRRKYGQRCAEGFYPEIAKAEELNFDLLKEPEEWALLFNFLLEYPSMIDRISEEMTRGKSNVHQICDFLCKLCSLFSVYYRRIRILLEPKNHLLETIQVRMSLAMAVEQVLENGLAIFNIKKVEQM